MAPKLAEEIAKLRKEVEQVRETLVSCVQHDGIVYSLAVLRSYHLQSEKEIFLSQI